MKCAAIAAGLALALTGFSSHGSRGGHGTSHSSGGGCSNSHKSNGSSGGSSTSDASSGSTSGTSGSTSGGGGGYNGNRYGSGYNNTTGSTAGSSSGSTSGTTATATASVTTCASAGTKGASMVRVSTGSGRGSHRYQVLVTFYDAAGATVDQASTSVTLGPNAGQTLQVAMSKPALASQVGRCAVQATA
ncbi:hypothetical protein [Streptomyces sp. NPDC056670]|uniref:hypothetical protein n=1 Tax=Streptomyces sp. NPDC056670 TaxID=3345904 RepID=UPI0036C46307